MDYNEENKDDAFLSVLFVFSCSAPWTRIHAVKYEKKRNRQMRDCSLFNEILYRCLIYKIPFIKYSKNVERFCYHLLSWKD
jgi:hypothetical protein